MQYDEFIKQVQKHGGLKSRNEAIRIVEAVLTTLGERIYRTESSDLAAQLPKGIKEYIFKRQNPTQTRHEVQRFPLEEFYNRVCSRANIGYHDAVRQSKAVISVLQEAVSAGELEDIIRELPEEYATLFSKSTR